MKKLLLLLIAFCCINGAAFAEGEAVAGDTQFSTSELFSRLEGEPTIAEIRTEAMKFAEVEPQKIERWRNGAKKKALLPKLSFGFDSSVSNTYEIYTSTSRDYTVMGPDDRTTKWGISLAWDMGELIWNDAQTSIDVRSKLMVQLRDDILDKVTKLYFERRRLQIDMLMNPPNNPKDKIAKDLRLQELTANIDALTGGYLSREIVTGKSANDKGTPNRALDTTKIGLP